MFHTSCVVYSQWSDTKLQVALVTRGLCLKVRLWYRIVQVLMMETTSTRSCWLASMSECERVSFSRVPTTSCKSSRWNRWFSARSRFATPVTCFVVSCLFLLYCILFVEKRSLPIVPHHIAQSWHFSISVKIIIIIIIIIITNGIYRVQDHRRATSALSCSTIIFQFSPSPFPVFPSTHSLVVSRFDDSEESTLKTVWWYTPIRFHLVSSCCCCYWVNSRTS